MVEEDRTESDAEEVIRRIVDPGGMDAGERAALIMSVTALCDQAQWRVRSGQAEVLGSLAELTSMLDLLLSVDEADLGARITLWDGLRSAARIHGIVSVELVATVNVVLFHMRDSGIELARRYLEPLIETLGEFGRQRSVVRENGATDPTSDAVSALQDGLDRLCWDLYYDYDDFPTAALLSAAVVDVVPGCAKAWLILAFSLLRQESFEEAIAAFVVADELAPESFRPAGLAVALRQVGRYSEALEMMTKAIERDPAYLQNRLGRAQIHEAAGEWESALEELQDLIDLAGRTEDIGADGRKAFSTTQYTREMRRGEVAAFAQLERLRIFVAKAQLERARIELHRIIESGNNANIRAGYWYLGCLTQRMADFPAAIEYFSAALALDDTFIESRIARAECYEAVEEHDSAADDLAVLAWRFEPEPRGAAEQALESFLVRHPDHIVATKALGRLLVANHQPVRGARLLAVANESNPYDWQVRLWIGLSWITHSDEGEEGEQWNNRFYSSTLICVGAAMGLVAEAVELGPKSANLLAVHRWLIDRCMVIDAVGAYFRNVFDAEPRDRAEELLAIFTGDRQVALVIADRMRVRDRTEPSRNWREAVAEYTRIRDSFLEMDLPILAANCETYAADGMIRLYELQSARNCLDAVERTFKNIGMVPFPDEYYFSHDNETEPAVDGPPSLLLDYDHLELCLLAYDACLGYHNLLSAELLHRVGDISGALRAIEAAHKTIWLRFEYSYLRAIILRDVGRIDEAGALLPLLRELSTPERQSRLTSLEITLHLHSDHNDQAIALAEQALDSDHVDPHERAVHVGNIVSAHLSEGRANQALAVLDRNPLYRQARPPEILKRHMMRANALSAVGGGDQAVLDEMLAAVDVSERFRQELVEAEHRTWWHSMQLLLYGQAVRSAINAGDNGLAFELIERSKARAYLDQLGNDRPGCHDDESRSLLADIDRARRRHAIATALSQSATPKGELGLIHEYQRLGGRIGADVTADDIGRIVELELASIDFHQRRLEYSSAATAGSELGKIMSASDIHALAATDGHCVVAEYFLDGDDLILLLITPATPEPIVIHWTLRSDRLQPIIDQLAAGSIRGMGSDLLYAVCAPMVEPIEQHCMPGDVVVIVPHRSLHYLPLHVPLIGRNPVCRLPSASVLRYRRRSGRGDFRRALVFGDPREDLVHAQHEAVAVAAMFGTTAFLAAVASKRTLLTVLDKSEQPNVLHLACHARFDAANPGNSALLLAQTPRSDDSELTVDDLRHLELTADLVTLSACRTGVSSDHPGDELVGLTRAFLHAGAQSLVVSLWEVDDLSTSLVMRQFYERLHRGDDLAEALRTAQHMLACITTAEAARYCEDQISAESDALRRNILRAELCGLRLFAGDSQRAIDESRIVLEELVGVGGVKAEVLRKRARRQLNLATLKAESLSEIDYGDCPFEHPYHWAAFTLVGNWR
ncbi:CHAT domain-containing protein [Nocardia takedensis]|uniref:CHAT domain-containing protein n=1 Tax=Nocardia takedensis TaxID=259390 RepID=UPI003F7726FB